MMEWFKRKLTELMKKKMKLINKRMLTMVKKIHEKKILTKQKREKLLAEKQHRIENARNS